MAPGRLSGFPEAVISGKNRVGRSHTHYWESLFRWDKYLWRRDGKPYVIKGN